jgi:hypothetical protein
MIVAHAVSRRAGIRQQPACRRPGTHHEIRRADLHHRLRMSDVARDHEFAVDGHRALAETLQFEAELFDDEDASRVVGGSASASSGICAGGRRMGWTDVYRAREILLPSAANIVHQRPYPCPGTALRVPLANNSQQPLDYRSFLAEKQVELVGGQAPPVFATGRDSS